MFIIASLEAFFAARADIAFATVFGSFARGTATSDSDVDLGVACNTALEFPKRMSLISELETITSRKIDLVDLQDVHGIILKQAMGGRLLDRKRPDVYASVLKRMLLDDADFTPLRRRLLRTRREAFLRRPE